MQFEILSFFNLVNIETVCIFAATNKEKSNYKQIKKITL
jgi:hypothetical protein